MVKSTGFIGKKTIYMVLLAILVVTVLTGCNQADGKAVTAVINDNPKDVSVVNVEKLIVYFSVPDNLDYTKDVQENTFSVEFASTHYRIFPIPVFETSSTEGTIIVENASTNKYPQSVEIYTKDDNVLIYSAELAVGEKVEKSSLLVGLPKGEYNCEAHIRNIDAETGEKLGGAVVDIKVTVLN